MLLFDLDNFKLINDTLGHRRGDELLVRVAETMQRSFQDSDTIARLGGDEFAALLTGLADDPLEAAGEVENTVRRLLAALAEPFGDSSLPHQVSASLGAVLFVGEDEDADRLLQKADIALYQAKSAGRNSFAFFEPELQQRLMRRHQLETELRAACRNGQLVPHYQPQVDAGGRPLGYELLVRWAHPTRGLLYPGEFIDIAEESGLVVELGNEVLRLAMRQLVAWSRDPQTRQLSVAVNISAQHFEHPEFEARTAALLDEYGVPGRRLKLEITESALAADLAIISARMHALRRLGVTLAIDDFGTGYSSLGYLKRLPLSEVKIDQGFVRDLLIDDNDRDIVAAIITLAKSLKMTAIAEGVETEEQRDALLALGCNRFQGYLFGRPAPPEALRKKL